jgi:hypothetical protein
LRNAVLCDRHRQREGNGNLHPLNCYRSAKNRKRTFHDEIPW